MLHLVLLLRKSIVLFCYLYPNCLFSGPTAIPLMQDCLQIHNGSQGVRQHPRLRPQGPGFEPSKRHSRLGYSLHSVHTVGPRWHTTPLPASWRRTLRHPRNRGVHTPRTIFIQYQSGDEKVSFMIYPLIYYYSGLLIYLVYPSILCIYLFNYLFIWIQNHIPNNNVSYCILLIVYLFELI